MFGYDTLISTLDVWGFFKSLDILLITAIAAESKKYFGGQTLTFDEVKNRMQPSVKVSDKGYTHWRCKLNTAGRGRVQCFSELWNRSTCASSTRKLVVCVGAASRPNQERVDYVERTRCNLRSPRLPGR